MQSNPDVVRHGLHRWKYLREYFTVSHSGCNCGTQAHCLLHATVTGRQEGHTLVTSRSARSWRRAATHWNHHHDARSTLAALYRVRCCGALSCHSVKLHGILNSTRFPRLASPLLRLLLLPILPTHQRISVVCDVDVKCLSIAKAPRLPALLGNSIR